MKRCNFCKSEWPDGTGPGCPRCGTLFPKSELSPATGSARLVKRVSQMSGEEIAAAIEASHPMETEEAGVMDADALAMHLVGVRHEKRELVNLVRWLLIGAPIGCDHDWKEKHDDSGQVDGGPGDHWSWRECRVCGEIEAPNDQGP